MRLVRKLLPILVFLVPLAAAAFPQNGSVLEIAVTGNQRVSKEAILAAMRTKVGQTFSQTQLDQDKVAIEDLGFFEAVDVRAKTMEPAGWGITVDVREWPVIKEIRIVGNTVVKTAEIQKAITVQPGQVFNLKNVKPSVEAITSLYNKKGYFARIDEFAPLKESPNTVSISVIELVVGEVKVVGNSRTRARVMKRLIKTRPGEPYSIKKWEADLRRIYGTQWFESVKSSEDDRRDLGKVDLTAEVKEARTGTLGLGLVMDPRTSIAGSFNVSDANFKGTGQSVGVNYLQGTTGGGASVDLNYGNPFMDARDTSMNLSLYSHVVYRFAGTAFGGSSNPSGSNRYTERRTGGTVGFVRPIHDLFYPSWSMRFERIKTANLNTTLQNDFIQQDGDVAVMTLGLTRNRRDVDIDPSRGDWARVSLEPGYSRITEVGGNFSDTSLLGNHNFLKSNLEYRAYTSPHQAPRGREMDAPRRVIAFRARYGAIAGTAPFFEQYFAGGSDTVRGYAEDRFWGKQTLLTSLEYRHPIQRALNVVGFVDYGGAWGGYGSVNTYTQYDTMRLFLGYGVGLNFRTPLGPIRLDFGFNSHGGNRTHFQIGSSF